MKKNLIIEDNFEIRENFAEILELEGYEVITASNGKVGAEKAFTEKPDLIFCDIMMRA
jgi:CRP/FNR family cyclic AMP-dependent transcriptional regulator